jgi:hypothetical protein
VLPSPNDSEPNSLLQDTVYRSPELPLHEATMPIVVDQMSSNTVVVDPMNADDDPMPVVAIVEEESSIQEAQTIEMDTSLLIVESNEGDDGRIQLDDTLPSCSSGYESAAPLTNVDINIPYQASSDDDAETDSITRSRDHSSSCQSEQSLALILSTVSSNIRSNATDDDEEDSDKHTKTNGSPVITLTHPKPPSQHQHRHHHHQPRQRDKFGKFRARSRSPTLHHAKKKRTLDEDSSSVNTITSDQIEQHLRTLLMPTTEQRRTRTRPIKTPTRLVEVIASNHSIKTVEPDSSNVLDLHLSSSSSSSSSASSSTMTADTDTSRSHTHEPTVNPHQSCTYNVTISNKPNKLGLTIKKVVQR